MSDKRSPADVAVRGAANRAALDLCLEPMRRAAKMHGYAVTVHGSLTRDIDLVAVPWTENAEAPDILVQTLCGAIAGALGCCRVLGKFDPETWTEKPHGRRAVTLIGFVGSTSIDFDVSIMPRADKPKEGSK